MRAHTKRKHEMGKRFAILIGAAAVGVLAVAVAPGGVAADPHAQAAAARPVPR